jgi:putative endonuclease
MADGIRNSLGRVGLTGEDLACDHLTANGAEILGRNVRVGRCEIDIIFRDGDHLVFAEVKTRTLREDGSSSLYGGAASSVDRRKRQNLISAAQTYIREHRTGLCPRIDVIEVYLERDGASYTLSRLNHIRNAVTRGR